ncbi:MAG: sigma-70 family RNA polymerase sigma factor [Polyangiaceae bacterium]|nr:sigma-70 family RNA polymerase sigma factor [Polyangiaceae bacterium]
MRGFAEPGAGRPPAEPGTGPAGRAPLGAAPELGREAKLLLPMVRAVIARVLQVSVTHADVDDCAAETLRRVVENIGRVRPGEPVGPWATGIARHVALDWLRAKKRERARSIDNGPTSSPPDVVDPGPTPEDRAADAQSLHGLRQALATLGDGPREALVMFHVEGRSYQEISARMNVPMGTVATWIARSRRTLADAMDRTRRDAR